MGSHLRTFAADFCSKLRTLAAAPPSKKKKIIIACGILTLHVVCIRTGPCFLGRTIPRVVRPASYLHRQNDVAAKKKKILVVVDWWALQDCSVPPPNPPFLSADSRSVLHLQVVVRVEWGAEIFWTCL